MTEKPAPKHCMNQDAITWVLNQPTLLRGVYFSTHKQIVLQYMLWFALTPAVWYGSNHEPLRAREWRHYLEAVGILRY